MTTDRYPVLFFFPCFSLPDVLCDSTDLIWREIGETMTCGTTFIDGLQVEVFWGFPR